MSSLRDQESSLTYQEKTDTRSQKSLPGTNGASSVYTAAINKLTKDTSWPDMTGPTRKSSVVDDYRSIFTFQDGKTSSVITSIAEFSTEGGTRILGIETRPLEDGGRQRKLVYLRPLEDVSLSETTAEISSGESLWGAIQQVADSTGDETLKNSLRSITVLDATAAWNAHDQASPYASWDGDHSNRDAT